MIPLFLLLASLNVLPNGSFDAGDATPDFWEKSDGLTFFWVPEPGRGRVLKLDSRLQQKQVREWHAALKKNPDLKPPRPIYSKPPYYDSVGGLDGAMADSGLMDVKPGQKYRLTIDVRGNSKPFVWIKGFREHPRRKGMMIDSYQTRLHAYPLDEQKWQTFSIDFNPTAKSPATKKMKVRAYVYWPVGVCYFDNVRIEEIP